jgi:hypothetical protein
LHGGPGFDPSGFKPAFSALADIQINSFDSPRQGDAPERWMRARRDPATLAFAMEVIGEIFKMSLWPKP